MHLGTRASDRKCFSTFSPDPSGCVCVRFAGDFTPLLLVARIIIIMQITGHRRLNRVVRMSRALYSGENHFSQMDV